MPVSLATSPVRLVLDTYVLSDYARQLPATTERVREYLRLYARLTTTAETVFERYKGYEKLLKQKPAGSERIVAAMNGLDALFAQFDVLVFDADAARVHAKVVARLGDVKGLQSDMRIAATAISAGYGIATRNEADFRKIGDALPAEIELRLAVWK
jgi:predicted nucleic acid-binding protein